MMIKGPGLNTAPVAFTLVILLVIISLSVPVRPSGGTTPEDPPNDEPSVTLAEQLQTQWPISNSTTPDEMRSPFGPRIQTNVGYDFHRAIDIPTPHGTPVLAIMAGQVRLAGEYPFYSEPVVQVRHEYNGSTFYANYQHLSAVHVVEDQMVEVGDLLGESGTSSSGFAHLHFAIREEGVNKIDASHPLIYLPYADQGPPELEAIWQEDVLHVNVSVGNQELDFVQLDIFGEGVDFHLNFVELNHATENSDDLDNDTLIIGGAEVTIVPSTYSQGQPRNYWFQFRFANETGDLTIQASDVLGQASAVTLTNGPEPPQDIRIQLVPEDVFSDVQLAWNASVDDGNISDYVIYRSLDFLGPYLKIGNITADGSSSYSYIDYGAGDGDYLSYFYKVHARNTSGKESRSHQHIAKWVSYLNPGWNVLSVPVISGSDLRTDALASIEGNYAILESYGSDQWDHWYRDKPPQLNDHITIDHKKGFYVLMKTDDHLVTAGEVLGNTPIDLNKGWNLVGYPSFTSSNRMVGINNLEFGVDIDIIKWYDAATKTWHFMGPDDPFVPGRGYWMHSRVDTTWEVPL